MLDNLSGATRVHLIVGDPIAQVKSPYGVTQAFEASGRNAICVPAHVAPADLAQWFAGISLARNVDGVIVTVPHKFDCHALCATSSPRAAFLGAVNTLRRNADGSWHGDMFDGLGYVTAMQARGCDLSGKKALLVGAGGAGSAIAHSLVLAGVGELAIHDENTVRRESLIARLNSLGLARVSTGSASPAGFDIAVNATPVGMQATDPLPMDVDAITADMFIGCVITAPAITPLIAAARARGCNTSTGADMFAQVRELMVEFLLA
ncbi:shikimate dehydrogenase [Rhodoferax lacus]|uniref:Shikimate dehydrogenase n=1 Tax=Rhodoferax lacus TaxID=2184758 RepID=A0A3E1RF69_9BURK|nr:ThiF family adenylyltransferase [Rhodoferax lacus]RFO97240.1 shikimate dehydrogenase [Rhodoferax lacus]